MFEGYAAGRATNFVGAKQILIKLPIKDVYALSRLGFDMTGSAAGTKDFELHYSFDEGDSYKEISLLNQFGNITANAKNSFTFNLDDLELAGEELWLKITPKAGDRGNGSAYNESTGTIRIDNLHLVGISPTSTATFTVNKFHYFIFHKTNGKSYQGITEDISSLDVELELPVGEYDIFFVLNSSDEELIFPTTISKAGDIYISNNFSNKDAEIYGYSGSFEVTGSMSINIVLQRLYSQVKIEFTDFDLSTVKSISINQVHEPYFYSPFSSGIINPILDQTIINVEEDFQSNKQIVFNQFMGLIIESKPVYYNVVVLGESSTVLRTFELTSTIKNNIQLVFRGELLPESTQNVLFQITKNEDWDGENEVSF